MLTMRICPKVTVVSAPIAKLRQLPNSNSGADQNVHLVFYNRIHGFMISYLRKR